MHRAVMEPRACWQVCRGLHDGFHATTMRVDSNVRNLFLVSCLFFFPFFFFYFVPSADYLMLRPEANSIPGEFT